MNAHADCCGAFDGGTRRRTLVRRCAAAAGWVVPGSILALIPKCPACVAGYVAVATGFGISMSAASYLRGSAIVLCAATLMYLTARTVRRRVVSAA